MELFITVKSQPLIDDLTVEIKRTAPAEFFQLHTCCESPIPKKEKKKDPETHIDHKKLK
jgi:hypothetical protein